MSWSHAPRLTNTPDPVTKILVGLACNAQFAPNKNATRLHPGLARGMGGRAGKSCGAMPMALLACRTITYKYRHISRVNRAILECSWAL